MLQRRPISNGVKPVKHHVVKNPQQSELIQDSKQHSVSFTLNRQQAIIVQYDHDSETDMFQIGRSSEGPIDFVVMDTVPGAQRAEDCVVTQSTISRFACRIIVERNPPYTARIYAAGFDSGRNIFLGVSGMTDISLLKKKFMFVNFVHIYSLFLFTYLYVLPDFDSAILCTN